MGTQSLINVVLVAPEIPHNTGNIIRLCANTGAQLHLIKPLGFDLSDANLRRAALDYRDIAEVSVYESFNDFLSATGNQKFYAVTPHGSIPYHSINYQPFDFVIFGSEQLGLPNDLLSMIPDENRIRIPMAPSNRSLNLSNAVAVVVYEMWRQLAFEGDGYSSEGAQGYFS